MKTIKGNLKLTENKIYNDNLHVEGNIDARNIYARNIDARNTDARNIDARNIYARNIDAHDINVEGDINADIIVCETIRYSGRLFCKKLIKNRTKLTRHEIKR